MQLKFFDFKVRGIDISKYDLKLNVESLLGKVHFVIVRIGHGTKTDPLFKTFWQALKGKIFRLAYFYLDYYSNYMEEFPGIFGKSDYEWGVIQGQNAWNNIQDDHDKKLIYLDIEQGDTSYAPDIDGVWNRVETMMDGFFDTYDPQSGLTNGIYASLSKLKEFSRRFWHRPAYVALYDEDDDGRERTRASVIAELRSYGWTGDIHFWQYASDGDTGTDGIGDGLEFGLGRKKMDLDTWMGTESEWQLFKDGQMTDILLNVPQFSQKDPRWKDIKLGTSNSTIGGYGCLMTDATMVARYYGHDVNPAQMNQLLIDNGGYVNGNLFVFGALTDIFPDVVIDWNNFINCIDTPAPLGTIDAMLLAGYPVIVQVDFNPSDADIDQHWVTIVGKQGGSYIINDPIDGARVKFEERYGDPSRYIFRLAGYKGTPAVIPDEEPLYRVRVRDGVTSLIIRSEPLQVSRTDTGKRAKAPEEYNVFEEQNGYGRIGVARWIALSFTQRITPIEPPELTLEERVVRLEKAVFG